MVYNDGAMGADSGSKSTSNRAIEILWLAVIFLIPLFFNSSGHQAFRLGKGLLLQFMVIVMLAAAIADWIQGDGRVNRQFWRRLTHSPLHMAVMVFGLIVIIATVASITPGISFRGSYVWRAGLLTTMCWITFFLVLAKYLRTRAQVLRAVSTLLASSGIVAILGILQHYFPEVALRFFHLAYGGRAYSTAGNPLSLSVFLAMVIPFNLAMISWFWTKGRAHRNPIILAVLCALLVLQLWCLWLAQYSITMLLYVIPVVVFVLSLGIAIKRKWPLVLGLVCLVAIAIVAALLLVPLVLSPGGPGQPEIVGSAQMSTAEEAGLVTVKWRVEYWYYTLDMIVHPPTVPFYDDPLHSVRTLIGYGPETFMVTIQQVYPSAAGDISPLFFTLVRPHNHYLYLATTVGLLGLVSFLSILVVFFYLCFRHLFKTTRRLERLLLIGLMAGMVAYLADLVFNPEWDSSELVFWLSLSLALALGKIATGDGSGGVARGTSACSASNESTGRGRIRPYLALSCVLLLMAVGAGLTVNPFFADMYLQKGLNLDARRSPEAVYAFEEAVEMQPLEATYWSMLGRHNYHMARRATELSSKRQFLEMSASACEKAKEQEPYIAFHYYTLADVYAYWAAQVDAAKWPGAFSSYDQALQLFPNNVLILNRWTLALTASGNL
jgi:O-antigen ligase